MNQGLAFKLVEIRDLGSARQSCSNCHKEHVRFLHVLGTSDGEIVEVGYICAAKLTGDVEALERRRLENEERRRKAWQARTFRRLPNGLLITETKRFVVTLVERKGWQFSIRDKKRRVAKRSKLTYPNFEEAKAKSFEAMAWMAARDQRR